MIKKDRNYTKDYAWVKIEGDIATIGISEKGAKMVEEFVFVDTPKKGEKITKGQDIINLEAMKWTGSIRSPFNGIVHEVNEKVIENPEIINKDPWNAWILKIKIKEKDLKGLLSPEEAEKYFGGE